MSHIPLPDGLPGIRGLMAYSPETARPLNALAEVLLRDDANSLSRGEREFIATYVSYLNDCHFCQSVHGAIAGHYLGCDAKVVAAMKADPTGSAMLSGKMKSLLALAAAVQQGGKKVTPELVAAARDTGVTDHEIHDTVLIAAAFCMYNRYVDGLGTAAPEGTEYYTDRAARRAEEGYADFDLYAVSR